MRRENGDWISKHVYCPRWCSLCTCHVHRSVQVRTFYRHVLIGLVSISKQKHMTSGSWLASGTQIKHFPSCFTLGSSKVKERYGYRKLCGLCFPEKGIYVVFATLGLPRLYHKLKLSGQPKSITNEPATTKFCYWYLSYCSRKYRRSALLSRQENIMPLQLF